MHEKTVSAVGFAHAKPAKAADLAALFVTLVDRSRREEGCLQSWVHQDLTDPNLFVFYEMWASDEDVSRHLAQPYMEEFLAGRMNYLTQDLEVRQLSPPLTGSTPEFVEAADPAQMNQKYLDAYSARDIDAIMAVYAPGASAVWQPGSTISGAEHRAAVVAFLKKEPKLSAEVRESYVTGDTAALVVDWSIEVPGAPEMTGSGTGFDILKKNAEGHWRYIITNPFGRP
ncbi:MAG: antibiotic biosynthesis monooxygenase [Frankia sp.]